MKTVKETKKTSEKTKKNRKNPDEETDKTKENKKYVHLIMQMSCNPESKRINKKKGFIIWI